MSIQGIYNPLVRSGPLINGLANDSLCGEVLEKDWGCVNFYTYGFNGMEKDDEVKGNGNQYTSFWRAYDPRIGRWLSLDPMMRSFPHQSPYVAFDNNPIALSDPNGNCTSCPDNSLGAPEAGEGDLTDNSFRVNSDWVAQNADNDFQYRNESSRKGYNFYWVPDGGDVVYKRDADGNMIPNENGEGYQTERQGAYYATPYLYVNQNVMTNPGTPAQAAVPPTQGTPAQFGWVSNPGAATTQSAPGWNIGNTVSNPTADLAISLGQAQQDIANLQSQDVANGQAVNFSNYSVNITFNQTAPNAYSNSIVSGFQSAGLTVTTAYEVGQGTVRNIPIVYVFNINYTSTPSNFQQTRAAVPGTPGQPAVPAVAPTFQRQWIWIQR